MPVQPQQTSGAMSSSLFPLLGSVTLFLTVTIGIMEMPLWALTLLFLVFRIYHSFYSTASATSSSPIVAINPLQLRLTLMDRDFNEADYEMLLALDDYDQTSTMPAESKKKVDAAISSLPIERVSSNQLQCWTAAGKQTCAICLDDFKENEDVITLPCSHHFHSDELETWLKRKSRCPICIRPLAV